MTRMKVIVSSLGIYDKPGGTCKGSYSKGEIIRTIDLNSKKAHTDGQIWVCYTQAGGNRFFNTKNWVVYEDSYGNVTMEED